MIFRTEIEAPKSAYPIAYEDKILMLGSCFAENIGNKLAALKYNILVNPFGILYNPISIAQSLNILQNQQLQTEQDIFEEQNIWKSFYFHSRFSCPDKDIFLNTINNAISKGSEFIKDANVYIITLGTAWIYELLANNQVVSNCHKIPAKQFRRYKISIEDIIKTLEPILLTQKSQQQALKVIFTVSPIRHIKDGLQENSLSKAILKLVVDYFCERYDWVYYLPAYEIVLDDLRDYRFYEKDMIHPSEAAVDYIWEYVERYYLQNNQATTREEISKLQKALAHRPFNPNTEVYKQFVQKNLAKIADLNQRFPAMDWAAEKQQLLTYL